MEGPRSGHSGEEPFVLVGMASLVGATAWTAFHPSLLVQFFYSPAHLALVHTLTLGFVTSFAMGVLLRLAPMALGVRPRSRALALVQWAAFVLGASGMVAHFARASWLGLAWSTLLVLLAAVLQLVNLSGVFRVARGGDPVALHASAAMVSLVLAALLGAAYGFQNAGEIASRALDSPFLARIGAHAHLAAVGWLGSLVLGFQLKLVPTTRGGPVPPLVRFGLLQAGVLGLTASLLAGFGLEWLFAALVLAALVGHALGPLRSFASRTDWIWEASALAVLVALGATGLLLALGWPPPGGAARLRVAFAYGYAGLYGWIVLTVAATSFKLFPLWVWKERFEADWGRKPVPSVVSLSSRALRNATGTLLVGGSLVSAAAILREDLLLARAGTILLLLGVLSFAANFVRTARWAILPLEYHPPRSARLPGRPGAPPERPAGDNSAS